MSRPEVDKRARLGGATWAVVPFKGRDGKRRLSALLEPDERAELARAMLDDVLAALATSPLVDHVSVVSPEGDQARTAGPSGVSWLVESAPDGATGETDGLNRALLAAQAAATTAGAARLLILPADLPLLTTDDVAALLAAAPAQTGGRNSGRIVLAPDGSSAGTNALLLEPPRALAPSSGVDSFQVHVAWAAELGLPYAIVRRPALLLDVDTPEDVARLLALMPEGRTVAVLRSLQLDRRAGWAASAGGPRMTR